MVNLFVGRFKKEAHGRLLDIVADHNERAGYDLGGRGTFLLFFSVLCDPVYNITFVSFDQSRFVYHLKRKRLLRKLVE